MMRRGKLIMAAIMVCGALFTACSEQDIEPFGTERFLYFDKFWRDASAPGTEKADSTGATFFFVEDDAPMVTAHVAMVLSGRLPEKDIQFQLRVVDGETTALPNEYTLQDWYTFRARPVAEDATRIADTISIQINRSPRLETMKEGYRLVLELVPNNEVQAGQYERSRAVIRITKDPVKPEWWTREVDEVLLGSYSALKYRLFYRNVEGADQLDGTLIKEHPDRARKLALEFKKWLIANPTWDEDNYEWMSVKV